MVYTPSENLNHLLLRAVVLATEYRLGQEVSAPRF